MVVRHARAWPAPVSTGLDYYAQRARDYAARHTPSSPEGALAYYLPYGQKYCARFCQQVRPWLTPRGRRWVDRTCLLLQQAIEQARAQDPTAFAALEEDARAFCAWAYATHAAAYTRGGIADLPVRDLILIAFSIDRADLLTPPGLRQAALVVRHLAARKATRLAGWLLARARRVSFGAPVQQPAARLPNL